MYLEVALEMPPKQRPINAIDIQTWKEMTPIHLTNEAT